jgi:hypothetical protein
LLFFLLSFSKLVGLKLKLLACYSIEIVFALKSKTLVEALLVKELLKPIKDEYFPLLDLFFEKSGEFGSPDMSKALLTKPAMEGRRLMFEKEILKCAKILLSLAFLSSRELKELLKDAVLESEFGVKGGMILEGGKTGVYGEISEVSKEERLAKDLKTFGLKEGEIVNGYIGSDLRGSFLSWSALTAVL